MKNKYQLSFLFIVHLVVCNLCNVSGQTTWTRTLFYDNGGYSPYHYDSLGVGPSGFAPRSDGKFFVMNMDYEQGQQTIYLLDAAGNEISKYPVGDYLTLQEWDCFGLRPITGNGCIFIEHYFDFGGAPPQTVTYKLQLINSAGTLSTLHTWNYPDVLTAVIPNYHGSYYCRVNGIYIDLVSGIDIPDSLIGLGPFVNDDFIYGGQEISRKSISGVVSWSVPSDGFYPVVYSENSVYLLRDSLRKLDATTGNILWTKELPVTGNYISLPFTDALMVRSGRNITILDSSGMVLGQNTIDLVIDPPAKYCQLNDGSIVGGGAFYSWSRYYYEYNRSGLVFKLDSTGQGQIDSTSFYHLGDADFDGVLNFYDDAVIIAAKLNETNSTTNLNSYLDYGIIVYSSDWEQSFECGLNLKYCDNNFDNVIDTNDFHLLSSYSPLTGLWQYPHEDSTGIPMYCTFSDSAGFDDDTLSYYIIIGNQGEPIDSVYGISLLTGIRGSVSYNYFDLQFTNGVLGDTATDLFVYSNNPYAPIMKSFVACRTDHQNITLAGGDTLATVRCVLNSYSIPGVYPAFLSAHIIGKEGYSIPFHPLSDSLNLIITSVNANIRKQDISVYPVPANDEINIVSEKNVYQIRILNTDGRLVYSEKYRSRVINIKTDQLKAGVYFVECNQGDKIVMSQILIAH